MKGKFWVAEYAKGDSKLIKAKAFFGEMPIIHDRLDALAGSKDLVAFTCFADDKAIAVIGGSIIYPGVADLWSIISEEVHGYPVAFCKLVKKTMERSQDLLNIHRFQMAIRCDLPELREWASFLGMLQEGLMKKFGPDKSDHYLYARTY